MIGFGHNLRGPEWFATGNVKRSRPSKLVFPSNVALQVAMQVKFIAGWLWVVTLFLTYCAYFGAYVILNSCRDGVSTLAKGCLIAFPAVFAVYIGSCYVVSRLIRARDSRGYARLAMLIVLTLPLGYVLCDAPPVERRYSVQDLISTNPAVLASYDALMEFRKNGGITVPETISNNTYTVLLTNVTAHAELISRAWAEAADARLAIEHLDSYPGIADLVPGVPLDMNIPFVDFRTLRTLSHTYAAYANLQTASGRPEEGARQLGTLHRVARKVLPYSTVLVNRMIWTAVARNDIEAAYAMLQSPRCTRDALQILRSDFPPLAGEDVSLRLSLIGEYVWLASLCDQNLGPTNFLDMFSMPDVNTPTKTPLSSLFRRGVSRLVYYLMFRKNRTLEVLGRHTDLLVEGVEMHPPDVSAAEAFVVNYCRHPDIRNLGGSVLIAAGIPSFARAAENSVRTKVLSDLLAVEIAERLGEPAVLPDYYGSDPYQRDAKAGRFFSVGPDEKAGTDDDIFIGKNLDRRPPPASCPVRK